MFFQVSGWLGGCANIMDDGGAKTKFIVRMIALKESMNSKESILIALKDTRNNILMIHN